MSADSMRRALGAALRGAGGGEHVSFGDGRRSGYAEGPEAFEGPFGIPAQRGPGDPSQQRAGVADYAHSKSELLEQGVKYRRVPVYPPFANLALDPSVVYMCRMRAVFFGGAAAGAAQTFAPQQFNFSLPTVVLARSGAGFRADDVALPVGRTEETIWGAFFQRVGSGDLLDGGTTPIVGKAAFGNGGQPTLYSGNGIFFDNGSTLSVTAQSLLQNVRIEIMIWCLEEYANLGR